jgi:hypothetical protein
VNGSDETMTAREAQEYLGISKRKMWELLEKDKQLSYERDPLDKRIKLIKRSDVEALKARSKRAA